jgi:hypothetical protein
VTNRFVGKPRMRRGSFGVTSPASPGGPSPISRPPHPPHAAPPDHPHGLGSGSRSGDGNPCDGDYDGGGRRTAAVNFLSAIRR